MMRHIHILLVSFLFSCFFSVLIFCSPVPLNSTSSWGPYRPGLYFGLRALHHSSPLFGLMFGPTIRSVSSVESIRHWAEERDSISSYSYSEYLPDYWHQYLFDPHLNIAVNFTGIRVGKGFSVRVEGNQWAPKDSSDTSSEDINFLYYMATGERKQTFQGFNSGETLGNAQDCTISLGGKGAFGSLRLSFHSSDVLNRGESSAIYEWNNPWNQHKLERVEPWKQCYYYGIHSSSESWNAKKYVQQGLYESLEAQYKEKQRKSKIRLEFKQNQKQRANGKGPTITQQMVDELEPDARELLALLPNRIDKNANLMIVQKVVKTPFTLQFLMQSDKEEDSNQFDQKLLGALKRDGLAAESSSGAEALASVFAAKSSEYDRLFESRFPLHSRGEFSDSEVRMAKYALANLLGGVGFWHGRSRHEVVDPKTKRLVEVQPESALISAVPSRSFFPRGFLWDEGFHELIISNWDSELSETILESWFGQMETGSADAGWIPREQILGLEARARVPDQFQIQRPTVANPPTLILTLGRLVARLEAKLRNDKHIEVDIAADGSTRQVPEQADSEEFSRLADFLLRVYPRLLLHADWYFRTQSSNKINGSAVAGASYSLDSATSFRWAGRTRTHCLASGLDDYPRAKWLPGPKDRRADANADFGVEGHVDLHSWMAALTRTMAQISHFLARFGPSERSDEFESLSDQFQAKSRQLASKLHRLHWNNATSTFCDYAYKNQSRHLVCHSGYVSLFPFLLGLLDPSDSLTQIQHVVNLMSDPERIHSPWGFLSLSKKDKMFGADENYWRGNIWANLNYLALQALKHYSNPELQLLAHTSPIQFDRAAIPEPLLDQLRSLYSSVRTEFIANLHANWRDHGFLFEQYDANSGKGKKSHPFTGWTALVINIMAEKY